MNDNDPQKTALEDRASIGEKLFSPSTERNRDVIRDVFLKHMPLTGRLLEIGAGTGEHAVHIASKAPDLQWHTGDPDGNARGSIAAWIADSGLTNLTGPHAIDVRTPPWDAQDEESLDAVVSINMVHIAPFEAARGLFSGANIHLREGGALFLYGPFARNGRHTAPSNEAFDAALRTRNNTWGVRDLDRDIKPVAQSCGLFIETIVDMPANNLAVVFRKKN